MSFKLSDRVKNQKSQEGIVVRIVPQHNGIDKYKVEFDDKNIPSAEFSAWQLTKIEPPKKETEDAGKVGLPFGVKQPKLPEKPAYTPPQCTCGVKFVRHGGEHSSWCDLKK